MPPFLTTDSNHCRPPTAKNAAPKNTSLDNQAEPSWLKALNARSGEPRCVVENMKPSPISAHRMNMGTL